MLPVLSARRIVLLRRNGPGSATAARGPSTGVAIDVVGTAEVPHIAVAAALNAFPLCHQTNESRRRAIGHDYMPYATFPRRTVPLPPSNHTGSAEE